MVRIRGGTSTTLDSQLGLFPKSDHGNLRKPTDLKYPNRTIRLSGTVFDAGETQTGPSVFQKSKRLPERPEWGASPTGSNRPLPPLQDPIVEQSPPRGVNKRKGGPPERTPLPFGHALEVVRRANRCTRGIEKSGAAEIPLACQLSPNSYLIGDGELHTTTQLIEVYAIPAAGERADTGKRVNQDRVCH